MNALDRLLNTLSKVRQTGSHDWIACCPAHADKNPSMTITERDGWLGIKCFAGCSIDEVAGAVGMELHEFFPERLPDEARKPARVPFNARDVLECVKTDALLLAVYIVDVNNGRPATEKENQNAFKAAARIVAATRMGGVQ